MTRVPVYWNVRAREEASKVVLSTSKFSPKCESKVASDVKPSIDSDESSLGRLTSEMVYQEGT